MTVTRYTSEAKTFHDFCHEMAKVARATKDIRNLKYIDWCGLTSGVEWDVDEDNDEYMRIAFVTANRYVYAEIDDGTYGNLNALRVYTGRQAKEA